MKQEAAETAQETKEAAEDLKDTVTEKLSETADKAKEVFNDLAGNVKEKLDDLDLDDLKQSLSDAGEKAKAFAGTAYKTLSEKLNSFGQDEGSGTVRSAAAEEPETETAEEKLNDTVSKLKDEAEKVGAAVTEGAKSVQKAVVDFASKPEVREALDNITDTAKDIYDKGVETLKTILKK